MRIEKRAKNARHSQTIHKYPWFCSLLILCVFLPLLAPLKLCVYTNHACMQSASLSTFLYFMRSSVARFASIIQKTTFVYITFEAFLLRAQKSKWLQVDDDDDYRPKFCLFSLYLKCSLVLFSLPLALSLPFSCVHSVFGKPLFCSDGFSRFIFASFFYSLFRLFRWSK